MTDVAAVTGYHQYRKGKVQHVLLWKPGEEMPSQDTGSIQMLGGRESHSTLWILLNQPGGFCMAEAHILDYGQLFIYFSSLIFPQNCGVGE